MMQRFVLSAAHCAYSHSQGGEVYEGVDWVRLGEWSVVDTSTFHKQTCSYYGEDTRTECEKYAGCRLELETNLCEVSQSQKLFLQVRVREGEWRSGLQHHARRHTDLCRGAPGAGRGV